MRKGNVFIDSTAYTALANTPLSLFIEDGHLILDNRIDDSMMTKVDDKGFAIGNTGE